MRGFRREVDIPATLFLFFSMDCVTTMRRVVADLR